MINHLGGTDQHVLITLQLWRVEAYSEPHWDEVRMLAGLRFSRGFWCRVCSSGLLWQLYSCVYGNLHIYKIKNSSLVLRFFSPHWRVWGPSVTLTGKKFNAHRGRKGACLFLTVVGCSFLYLKERLGNQTRVGEDAYEPRAWWKSLRIFLIKVTSLTLAFKVLVRCFPPLVVVLYDFEINCQEKSASVMIHRHAVMLH